MKVYLATWYDENEAQSCIAGVFSSASKAANVLQELYPQFEHEIFDLELDKKYEDR